VQPPASEELALAALEWIEATAVPDGDGVWWSGKPSAAEPDPTLYHGTAGIVLALLEADAHFSDRRWRELAVRGTRWLAAAVDTWDTASYPALYFGTAGTAFALHEAAGRIGAAYGWCHGPAGDAQVFRLLAQLADDRGGAGGTRDGSGASGAGHTSGDASGAGGSGWRALADRCWHTVTTSGLPQRLRPGFWDNSGRCCGTAGVPALACDREVENGDGLAFADLLLADLGQRATVDDSGARWSNVEYRATPPELEPRPGWAMGNAGLVRELLRHARITAGRDPSYAVQWPDHPSASRMAPGRPPERAMVPSEG
jgi:Lanthionine synthetase C-like protein